MNQRVQEIVGLKNRLAGLMGQLNELRDLGFDSQHTKRETEELRDLSRVIGVFLARPLEVAPSRLSETQVAMKDLGYRLLQMEKKFYVSEVVAIGWRRRMSLLEPECTAGAREVFRRWDSMRVRKTPLSSLKAVYAELVRAVEAAEEISVELRVKKTMVPEKPAQKRHRSASPRKILTSQAGPKKGSHAEIPNTGGTSRKVKAKQRRRARLSS